MVVYLRLATSKKFSKEKERPATGSSWAHRPLLGWAAATVHAGETVAQESWCSGLTGIAVVW